VDEFPTFSETISYGSGPVKVVHIKVEGPIMRTSEDGLFIQSEYDKVEQVLRRIRAAGQDKKVKGILLEVNSPGGAVTPSDEIYNALKLFKEADEARKVVVFMRDMAASGGYYVSMASDWIIAEPTTIVGSIGVIMQALNFSQLSEKIGVSSTTIASGENKDILNPFNPVDTNHIEMMQVMIDDTYEQFLSIVSAGRDIDPEVLRPICDGRIFTPKQALDYNLIDSIGYFESAISKSAELLGQSKIKLVRYENQPKGFFEVLMNGQAAAPDFADMLHESTTPRLMFMLNP
jgi:protease-4